MDEERLIRIEGIVFRAASDIADEHGWDVTIAIAQTCEDGNLRLRGRQIFGESPYDPALLEKALQELENRIAEARKAGHEPTWPQILVRSGDEDIDYTITLATQEALEAFEGEQEVETGAGGTTLSKQRKAEGVKP